jgi:ELMO domain-containing protein
MVMDQKWLDMHATYMDFNVCLSFLKLIISRARLCIKYLPSTILTKSWNSCHQTVIKSTRHQLERELLLEDVKRIEDMPSYRFLAR